VSDCAQVDKCRLTEGLSEPAKYPVRGWLHSLLEGLTNIEEAEEAINGFIEHAQDRAWREGVRIGTTHNPYKSQKVVLSDSAKELRHSCQDATARARADVHKWDVDND
jgi:hypothetical protein